VTTVTVRIGDAVHAELSVADGSLAAALVVFVAECAIPRELLREIIRDAGQRRATALVGIAVGILHTLLAITGHAVRLAVTTVAVLEALGAHPRRRVAEGGAVSTIVIGYTRDTRLEIGIADIATAILGADAALLAHTLRQTDRCRKPAVVIHQAGNTFTPRRVAKGCTAFAVVVRSALAAKPVGAADGCATAVPIVEAGHADSVCRAEWRRAPAVCLVLAERAVPKGNVAGGVPGDIATARRSRTRRWVAAAGNQGRTHRKNKPPLHQ
jgi:hypothetical protein